MVVPTPAPSDAVARSGGAAGGRAWIVPGLQMAAAVLLAWGLSWLAHLPEGIWAAMSALIVARPHTGAALGAGFDRLKGTLVGCVVGMGAVMVGHHGPGVMAVGLPVVALLAFVSAARPGWRSAPLAALIVFSGSAAAGMSSAHVAGLRVVEVGLGALAGMAVSFLTPATRSAAMFDAACAALLRDLAEQMRGLGQPDTRPVEVREASATERRARLRALGELAIGADRVRKLLRRAEPGRTHLRAAAVAARVVQDVALFGRTFESVPEAAEPAEAAAWVSLGRAGGAALDAVAAMLLEPATASAEGASAIAALSGTSRPQRVDELPLRWLAEDLRALLRPHAAVR